ncbi:NADH-quinone oxidoreductase subunit J [Pseudactinotalea suaedae]|jgi:NADH-quinone oxidoreductase subunit J|uniref:NADH-quinone oxidoreductase subunit J n=1 Tax=Pseudactinotalea suaedae TaxID=1524924 RepID=UPI001F4F57A2|nr:NADH-quinone oxidoreductase subunit J [Pseudactinotalea suaedae]
MTEMTISSGEAVLFWILAPLMVMGALGLLFARRTVHIAVAVAGVMVGLAVMYIANEATFLGVAQVVVYTGAVMMLFVFVIMLIGVDSTESLKETLTGQRWLAALAGVGLLVLMGAITTRAALPAPVGLAEANADTNAVGVARILFSDFIFPFELTGALLITAAVGALSLTHRVRLGAKFGQKEMAAAKLKAYGAGASSTLITNRPNPGVYARHNSADMPAVDAAGEPVEASITTVLRIRGQESNLPSAEELADAGRPYGQGEEPAAVPGAADERKELEQ